MRIDLYHRVNQNRRFLAQLAIRMCLMVPITYVGGGLVRYIYNAAGLIDSLGASVYFIGRVFCGGDNPVFPSPSFQ